MISFGSENKMKFLSRWRLLLLFSCFLSLPQTNLCLSDREVEEWLHSYNSEAEQVYYESQEAYWQYSTNLTTHNLRVLQEKSQEFLRFVRRKHGEATQLEWQNLTDPLKRRQFVKITQINKANLPANISTRMTELTSAMKRIYSIATVCNRTGDSSGKCYPLDPDLTAVMAKSNDSEELKWAWKGWRDSTGRHMTDMFEEYVEILNLGAKLSGYEDNGDYWRSTYESATFADDCEALWREMKPLYEQLHAYARRKLKEKYAHVPFPAEGHIPAHLLGNMWSQSWENIEDILRPSPNSTGMDVTDELIKQNYTVLKIFKLAESFFTSLGLEPMPSSFWEKSMFVKPTDRNVVCHASAHDFYNRRDFRVKQCTEVNTKWLFTTHHEMGHIQYYLNYKDLPVAFRDGANPGFHEAIGDVASLSVSTPDHLQSLGLLPHFVDDTNGDLNFLMQQALMKVAFIPFGFLIDQWRWDVFSGRAPRGEYNRHWWQARCKYQGLSPPLVRTEEDFDAGAKFHVLSGVPYMRYFVAHVIQFQFHEALCMELNNTRPLHRCDVTNSTQAGNKLKQLLRSGSSKPWPEVLKELTGSERMSASSLMRYYDPLFHWLKEQNRGHPIGWGEECPPRSFGD